jgi:NAD+ kinase
MKKDNLPRLVLFGDPKKGHVAKVIEEFMDFVKNKAQIVANCNIDACSTDVLKKVDFAVVFGGDGSIISAARYLSQSGVPVIGVNLGKLGYLVEFSIDEIKKLFDRITSKNAPFDKRMMLNCSVISNGKEKFSSAALNDIFIAAGAPFKMVELQIRVDGQPLAGCISDGLVISTPTGSTAYNLSAGGPILSGRMEAMVIAPMCPHSLSFRPIVIGADSVVEVIGVRVNKGTTVSVDGQLSVGLAENDVVKVEKCKGYCLIVSNPTRTQWDTLATKLSWAEKPKYERNDTKTKD